jgi:hypothetical protein
MGHDGQRFAEFGRNRVETVTSAKGLNLAFPSGRGVGGEGRPMSWAVTRNN